MFRGVQTSSAIIAFSPDGMMRITMLAGRDIVSRSAKVMDMSMRDDLLKEVTCRQPRAKVAVLLPRTSCLMGAFRLPSTNREELLSMAAIQFARSTPHRQGEFELDVHILDPRPGGQSLVAGVMAAKGPLKEYMDAVEKAGIIPAVVTPDTSRLLPVAERVWGAGLSQGGYVIALEIDGGLSCGLISGGTVVFSREERTIVDKDTVLGTFVEHCHKEFSSVGIIEGALVGGSEIEEGARTVAGVSFSTHRLSGMTRSPVEERALTIHPSALLDVMLLSHKKTLTSCFDLSNVSLRESRRGIEQRRVVSHWTAILSLILLGGILRTGSEIIKTEKTKNTLKNAITEDVSRVKDLEAKEQIVSSARSYLTGRVTVTSLIDAINTALPPQARLTEIHIADGKLTLRGEGRDLESIRSFAKDLEGKSGMNKVMLQGVDKRPAEKGEIVFFSISAEVKK